MIEAFIDGFDITTITNNAFYVVLIMMMFDVITGLLVAGKEKKINSSISFDGLIRKFGLIVALFFVSFIDVYFKTNGELVALGLGMIVLYEGISIIENFKLLGIEIKFLGKYFDPEKTPKEEGKKK